LRGGETIPARSRIRKRQALTMPVGQGLGVNVEDYRRGFCARMDDDLDTVGALVYMTEIARIIVSMPDYDTRSARRVLADLAGVLGLPLARLNTPQRRPQAQGA